VSFCSSAASQGILRKATTNYTVSQKDPRFYHKAHDIYLAAVLDGLRGYVQAPYRLRPCLCGDIYGCSSYRAETRPHGSRPTDDPNPSRVSRVSPVGRCNACFQHTAIHDQCYSLSLVSICRHIIIWNTLALTFNAYPNINPNSTALRLGITHIYYRPMLVPPPVGYNRIYDSRINIPLAIYPAARYTVTAF